MQERYLTDDVSDLGDINEMRKNLRVAVDYIERTIDTLYDWSDSINYRLEQVEADYERLVVEETQSLAQDLSYELEQDIYNDPMDDAYPLLFDDEFYKFWKGEYDKYCTCPSCERFKRVENANVMRYAGKCPCGCQDTPADYRMD